MEVVTVVCDRCGRPGWQLEIAPLSGEVIAGGARIGAGDRGADGSPYWQRALSGRRAHRYRAGRGPGTRAGAFIIGADAPSGRGGERDKLVCIGKRHPRYERVVTRESAGRAYRSAVAAGRTSIRLSEI